MKFPYTAPIIIFIFFFFYSATSYSQKKKPEINTHNLGAGFRMGWNPGITIKSYFKEPWAIEGILHLRYGGMILTGLIEKHAPAIENSQFQWFFGAGGHMGFYRFRPYFINNRDRNPYLNSRPAFGIDGILGLEYYIQEIPFTIGADVKPFLDFLSPGIGFDAALSVRYNF